PGGCGGSTTNGCGNVTCYYPYVSCCTYTITASYCSSQCKYTSSSSCVKDGTTYYSSCGSSKCSSEEACINGKCVAPSGRCCDDTHSYCGNSTYYNQCRLKHSYPDCSDMLSSCLSSGGTKGSGFCTNHNTGIDGTIFNCK
ncbi:MAG: hypothetical protein SO314_03095, partial [Alphaproteobacteria bacterium]|nr:hypothetical protein [Alphaproteobacteria bacterium]